jgi:ACT domain-containing protein
MKYSVEKIDFWSVDIRDEVGGLAAGLRPLVDAGSNFVFVIARRQPDKPGSGLVFLGGISGAKQSKAALAAGFAKAELPGLRIQTVDKPGTVETIVTQMAEAGINLRGVTAAGTGTRCSVILAFDAAKDRDKAARLLRSGPPAKRSAKRKRS